MELRRPLATMLILLGAAFLLAPAITQTIAITPEMKETPLNEEGQVHELFRDEQGNLWISDIWAGEIWQVDPFSGSYTVYENLYGASDGRLDSSGNLWWSNFDGSALGRLVPGADQATIWTLAEDASPLGIAFDDSDQVWVADVFSPDLYHFAPASSQLCTYPVPNNGTADYILFHGGQIWLGDPTLGRVLRFDPESETYTIWKLPTGAKPQGMAFDGNGSLWWADPGLGVLGQLIPQSNQVTTFAVPAFGAEAAQPQAVAIKSGEIWYTDQSGSVGMLDPALASGDSSPILPSTTSPQTPNCETTNGTAVDATKRVGTLTWTDAYYTPVVDSDGWLIYALPEGAAPWGLAVNGENVWFNDQGDYENPTREREQMLGWMHFPDDPPPVEDSIILLPVVIGK